MRASNEGMKEAGRLNSQNSFNSQSQDFPNVPESNRDLNQDDKSFNEFREELEDWWCMRHGIDTLPPDSNTQHHIKWFYHNKISLTEIQKFYEYATTDPEEKWRKGPVTIGAIVKGMPSWRTKNLSNNSTVAKLPSATERCTNCDYRGLVNVFKNGVRKGLGKCDHKAQIESAPQPN